MYFQPNETIPFHVFHLLPILNYGWTDLLLLTHFIGSYILGCASRMGCLAGMCDTGSSWARAAEWEEALMPMSRRHPPKSSDELIRNVGAPLLWTFWGGFFIHSSSWKHLLSPLTQEGCALPFVLWGCPNKCCASHSSVTTVCPGPEIREFSGVWCVMLENEPVDSGLSEINLSYLGACEWLGGCIWTRKLQVMNKLLNIHVASPISRIFWMLISLIKAAKWF